MALIDPKFPHNVGGALRAASCFGARQVSSADLMRAERGFVPTDQAVPVDGER